MMDIFPNEKKIIIAHYNFSSVHSDLAAWLQRVFFLIFIYLLGCVGFWPHSEARGLAAPRHVWSSCTRDWTSSPCVARWSPYHGAIGEVWLQRFYKNYFRISTIFPKTFPNPLILYSFERIFSQNPC